MKKYIIIALICLFILPASMSQKNQYYSINYSTAMLLGHTHDFIPNYSWRGFSFSGKVFVHKNIAVGAQFGFNNFYGAKDKQLYDIGDGTKIYAATYNYIKMVPFGANLYYFPIPNKMIQPYLGFTIGACFTTETVYIQDFRAGDDQYGFSIAPEVGVYAKFGDAPAGLKLAVAYNYTTCKYDLGEQNYNGVQALTVNLGITYMLQYKAE